MQRNAVKLQQLAVQQRLADLQTPVIPVSQISAGKTKKRRRNPQVQQKQPLRSSARVRGVAADQSQPCASSDAAGGSIQEEAGSGMHTW